MAGYTLPTDAALREAERPNPGEERCVGPFAFAKGPLVLLSAPAVRWVVRSDGFANDVAQAARLADGLAYGRASERVPQDVQLGYWLSRHPSLRYVALPRKTGWADAFVEVTDLRRLLVGHRIPWDQLGWLTGRSERMWRAASHVRWRLVCAGALPCPAGQCAHARGQDACAAELMLPPPLRASPPRVPIAPAGTAAEMTSCRRPRARSTRARPAGSRRQAICVGALREGNATTHDLRCRSSPRIAGMADLTETQRTRGPSATTYADAASPALRGGYRLHRTVWAPHILISVCSFTVISSSFCVAFERVAFSHIKIASGHIK